MKRRACLGELRAIDRVGQCAGTAKGEPTHMHRLTQRLLAAALLASLAACSEPGPLPPPPIPPAPLQPLPPIVAAPPPAPIRHSVHRRGYYVRHRRPVQPGCTCVPTATAPVPFTPAAPASAVPPPYPAAPGR